MWFGKGKTTLGIARSLFFNCKNAADHGLWYTAGNVSREFRSRQQMIMVHVWMIHRRLITEGSRGTTLQECMFDELWDDTSIRIRNAGIHEMMVNKRLKDVQSYSFRACMELDAAMSMASEDEKLEEVAGSLWRSVFLRNNDIEPDHVIEMAEYVKSEAASIMDLPTDAVLEGRVGFADISSLWANGVVVQTPKKVMKGGKYVSVDGDAAQESNAGDWKTNLSSNGTLYYYNVRTRQTSWEKPVDYIG